MKKPAVLSFITGAEKAAGDKLRVTIVRKKSDRSRVDVVVDQAGEACIKTPRAVPLNDK